jgi:hypothetical protein
MDERPGKAQTLILSRIYPELLYDSDPDIETYFELRREGRSAEALHVYTHRLAKKYPDEERRIQLLKFYRTKDPGYRPLLRQAALDLANSHLQRVKRVILALVGPLRGLDLRDTYRTLKAVEEVVRFLPADKYEASRALDLYRQFAQALDFHTAEMNRSAELAREYLFESNQDEDSNRVDFMARSYEMEQQRRAKAKKSHFDLSRIKFDPSDIRRIVLPPQITRKEDKVIGYCYKYWLQVGDPAFERIVLLYSRKFRTTHYDIYRAVKIGRQRRFTDDEILNTVSTVLSSSYSYSVQGDIYMQVMWRRLKANLSTGPQAARPLLVVPTPTTLALPPPPAAPAEASPRPERKAAAKKAAEPIAKKAPVPVAAKVAPTAKPKRRGKPARLQASEADAAPKKPIGSGSVSDIIKRLSGRTYDVYHDIFLASVRPSIRAELVANRTKSHGLFDDSMNRAEELVYHFIETNYDNAYMDWAGSTQRAELAGLGYQIAKLEPLIEHCYRRL